MTDTRTTPGQAVYFNKVSKQTYDLGFFYDSNDETELSRAWDLVSTACTVMGWRAYDVVLRAGR